MKLRMNFNWKLAFFVVFFLPILIRLGFWQLDRAEEKKQIQIKYEKLIQQEPIDLKHVKDNQWENYRTVFLTGEFRKEQWLIDNQIYQGKFGYEVIQPFTSSVGETILVSRGWTEGNLDRSQLPLITTPIGQTSIQGYLYSPSVGFELGKATESRIWPKVEQSVNIENMYKAIAVNDKISRPFLLRLRESEPSVLVAHWQIINTQPEKHTAYAMQWFGMSLLLVILFGWASINGKQKPSQKANKRKAHVVKKQ